MNSECVKEDALLIVPYQPCKAAPLPAPEVPCPHSVSPLLTESVYPDAFKGEKSGSNGSVRMANGGLKQEPSRRQVLTDKSQSQRKLEAFLPILIRLRQA